jgi:hypothetical protein
MTAVLYDEVVTTAAAPRLTLAPAPKQASKRVHRAPAEAAGGPLVDVSARLLSIPLRHLYAMLWRAGVIEVRG